MPRLSSLALHVAAMKDSIVKTKHGFATNAPIIYLDGRWQRGPNRLRIFWYRRVLRFHDGATKIANEREQKVSIIQYLLFQSHFCGSNNMKLCGSCLPEIEKTRDGKPTVFWRRSPLPKFGQLGFRCTCGANGCPQCCECPRA